MMMLSADSTYLFQVCVLFFYLPNLLFSSLQRPLLQWKKKLLLCLLSVKNVVMLTVAQIAPDAQQPSLTGELKT